MQFKRFAEAYSSSHAKGYDPKRDFDPTLPDHAKPHKMIRGPYVPPKMWWNSTKGCIKHLEDTHHTVNVLKDGTLHITGDLNLIDYNVPFLSVKFHLIEGKAKLQGNKLTSFDWAHNLVIKGDLDVSDNKLISLKGIGQHLRRVDRNINLAGNKIDGSILGLLLFPCGELHLSGWSHSQNDMNGDAERAFRIVEKYRLRYAISHQYLIDAQNDLFEAGLERFAEL